MEFFRFWSDVVMFRNVLLIVIFFMFVFLKFEMFYVFIRKLKFLLKVFILLMKLYGIWYGLYMLCIVMKWGFLVFLKYFFVLMM